MSPRPLRRPRRAALAAILTTAALVTAACGHSSATSAKPSAGTPAGLATGSKLSTNSVKLGFFPNITHAPALIAIHDGLFTKALGDGVKLTTATFNAGTDAIQAVLTGAIDISYIGPNPTINGFSQSHGQAVRVIAGAASGGAALVVKPTITTAADLKGKKIATPSLGNTQDVALRYWLKQQGLATDPRGGGDVHIVPEKNSVTTQAFAQGAIDGAWVPEPYATTLVRKSGGHVLVDERTLWPQGRFVTTNIIVRTDFLTKHADVVEKILEGHVAALAKIHQDPAGAQASFNAELASLTGQEVKAEATAAAWKNLEFTADPLPATLLASAQHASDVGLLDLAQFTAAGGVHALYDLAPLNQALAAAGQPEVTQP